LANVRSDLFYFDFFAGCNLVLLATGFYDRVHISPFLGVKFLRVLLQATSLQQTRSPRLCHALHDMLIQPSASHHRHTPQSVSGPTPVSLQL
jgi:hypothetical protein